MTQGGVSVILPNLHRKEGKKEIQLHDYTIVIDKIFVFSMAIFNCCFLEDFEPWKLPNSSTSKANCL